MGIRMAVMIGCLGAGLAAAEPEGVAVATPPTIDRAQVRFRGDLRLRHERIDTHPASFARERIRVRLEAQMQCDERLTVGLGFSTGGADPVSSNQTLGEGFEGKDVRLSLAYIECPLFGHDDPTMMRGVAGKMHNPLCVFPGDLVWDPDLTPEGLALKVRRDAGPLVGQVHAGSFRLGATADGANLMLHVVQVTVKWHFAPEAALTLGASQYAFQNFRGADVLDWKDAHHAYGNRTVAGRLDGGVTNRAWASGFAPTVALARLDLAVAGRPLSLFVQELHNGEADGRNRGRLCGATYGRADKPGMWQLGYSHAELEPDATVGLLTDSDRWGGGTDGRGHKLYACYRATPHLKAGATWFMDHKGLSTAGGPTKYQRLQLDVTVEF